MLLALLAGLGCTPKDVSIDSASGNPSSPNFFDIVDVTAPDSVHSGFLQTEVTGTNRPASEFANFALYVQDSGPWTGYVNNPLADASTAFYCGLTASELGTDPLNVNWFQDRQSVGTYFNNPTWTVENGGNGNQIGDPVTFTGNFGNSWVGEAGLNEFFCTGTLEANDGRANFVANGDPTLLSLTCDVNRTFPAEGFSTTQESFTLTFERTQTD